jgi:hypothetical protein
MRRKCRENTAVRVFSRLETMRHLGRTILVSSLVVALAALLSACGSSGGADLLPGTTANQINSNLDEVQRLVSEGECEGATGAAGQVSAEVEELGGVDAKLKEALREGAERLEEVVLTCEETEEEPAETTEEEEPEVNEDEEAAKHEKQEGSKPTKEHGQPAEPAETPGHEEENGEGTPEENGTPSGGLGPGTEVEGE